MLEAVGHFLIDISIALDRSHYDYYLHLAGWGMMFFSILSWVMSNWLQVSRRDHRRNEMTDGIKI